MEFSFCTPDGLVPFTAITVLLFDESELEDAESFIFLADGSHVFPWEPENMSISVRWRLTWVDATVADLEAASSSAGVPREGSKSSR